MSGLLPESLKAMRFLKLGAVVFGSGYVLLAFLRADLVVRHGWLADRFATPRCRGRRSGNARTGICHLHFYWLSPWRRSGFGCCHSRYAFLWVAASGPVVPRIRRSKTAGAFLDGINVGSLALMAEVTWQLRRTSLVDIVTMVLAVVSMIALLRLRLNSACLVLIGAVMGLITRAVQHGP
jgi:chromate transporter